MRPSSWTILLAVLFPLSVSLPVSAAPATFFIVPTGQSSSDGTSITGYFTFDPSTLTFSGPFDIVTPVGFFLDGIGDKIPVTAQEFSDTNTVAFDLCTPGCTWIADTLPLCPPGVCGLELVISYNLLYWTCQCPNPNIYGDPFSVGETPDFRYCPGCGGFTARRSWSVSAGVAPVLPVAIEIEPGANPANINPKSHGKIPVAILSTASFNAPSSVNSSSLKFGRTGNEASLALCQVQDVNGDGLADLLCLFTMQLTGFQAGDTQGVLTGQTVDGTSIKGTGVGADRAVLIQPGSGLDLVRAAVSVGTGRQ